MNKHEKENGCSEKGGCIREEREVVIVNSIVSARIYVSDVKRRGFLLLYV